MFCTFLGIFNQTDPTYAIYMVGGIALLFCNVKNDDIGLERQPVVKWYKIENSNEIEQDSELVVWDSQQSEAKPTITISQHVFYSFLNLTIIMYTHRFSI